MVILINCTGKFCYRQGSFQNTEATNGGVHKLQIKVSSISQESTYARDSFFIKLQAEGKLLQKEILTQASSCELQVNGRTSLCDGQDDNTVKQKLYLNFFFFLLLF